MSIIIDGEGSYITQPFHMMLASDGITNAFNYSKFGYNDDVDTGAVEVIASQGGTFTPLTAASTLTIVSSSTDDDDGGTGANTIAITGIDANKEEVTEVVTMNGTTNVITTSTWYGINRVLVATAGSNQSNVGNITITATTGGTIQSYLVAGDSISNQMIYHVPSTHNAYITRLVLEGGKTTGGALPKYTVKGIQLLNGVQYNLFETIMDISVHNNMDSTLVNPVKIAAGSVVYFTVVTDTSNGFVRGRMEMTLIKTDA